MLMLFALCALVLCSCDSARTDKKDSSVWMPTNDIISTGSLSCVSNVNGYSSAIAKAYPEIDRALQDGTVYYMNEFGKDEFLETYQKIAVGEATVDEGIQMLNGNENSNIQQKLLKTPPRCAIVAE